MQVEGTTLRWNWDKEALRQAVHRDGAYLLRTNLVSSDPQTLWRYYIQLTEVEAAFRALKSNLAIRPIWHFTERRVQAHIMVAFLGYCLWVCLRRRKLKSFAPSLTPWQMLDQSGERRARRGFGSSSKMAAASVWSASPSPSPRNRSSFTSSAGHCRSSHPRNS